MKNIKRKSIKTGYSWNDADICNNSEKSPIGNLLRFLRISAQRSMYQRNCFIVFSYH